MPIGLHPANINLIFKKKYKVIVLASSLQSEVAFQDRKPCFLDRSCFLGQDNLLSTTGNYVFRNRQRVWRALRMNKWVSSGNVFGNGDSIEAR
jgi:hypothetical protein